MASPSVAQIDDLLPQTQCNRCRSGGCLAYARGIVEQGLPVDRCAPGGPDTVFALSQTMGLPPSRAQDPQYGLQGPLLLARIDEPLCIGCTLCIQACPVDAIVGAVQRMHVVLDDLCTGCELCVAPCPMDCIRMEPAPAQRTWDREDARLARDRLQARAARLERLQREDGVARTAKAWRKLDELAARDDLDAAEIARRQSVVRKAIERARQRLGQTP